MDGDEKVGSTEKGGGTPLSTTDGRDYTEEN